MRDEKNMQGVQNAADVEQNEIESRLNRDYPRFPAQELDRLNEDIKLAQKIDGEVKGLIGDPEALDIPMYTSRKMISNMLKGDYQKRRADILAPYNQAVNTLLTNAWNGAYGQGTPFLDYKNRALQSGFVIKRGLLVGHHLPALGDGYSLSIGKESHEYRVEAGRRMLERGFTNSYDDSILIASPDSPSSTAIDLCNKSASEKEESIIQIGQPPVIAEVLGQPLTDEERESLIKKIESRFDFQTLRSIFSDYVPMFIVGTLVSFGGSSHHSGEISGSLLPMPSGRLAVVAEYDSIDDASFPRFRAYGVLKSLDQKPQWSAKFGGSWNGEELDPFTSEESAYLKTGSYDIDASRLLNDGNTEDME